MKYIAQFDSFRDEYPGMFEPVKPEDEPQSVPGFEGGTIDPDDDEVYTDPYGNVKFNEKSEKEQYDDFKKITRERNFYETPEETMIDTTKLYHDFIMSIYSPNKHYMEFIKPEILGKYIYGVKDFIKDITIEGEVEDINFYFSGNNAIISVKIKNSDSKMNDTLLVDPITIDKLKSSASKYNL